jgi:hypothetical protein
VNFVDLVDLNELLYKVPSKSSLKYRIVASINARY